jgi:hypothetical protein
MVITWAALLAPASAAAEEAAWGARVGWERTNLGAARNVGFGVTGGHTIRGGVERVLLRPGVWIVSGLGEGRVYGFEIDGPRTIGVELDVGLRLERPLLPSFLDLPLRVGTLVSLGAFRAPLATAIGRTRFLGVRPAFEIGGAYAWRSGAEVRLAAGCRLYSTLVWSGCSWSGSALAGWSW